jgi:protein-glutamine gamma-glutamyltransferase
MGRVNLKQTPRPKVSESMKAFPLLHLLPQWTRRDALRSPSPAVEDSLWLRIAVQALVSVGIAATDVAASSMNSLWAIPFSIAGATWSWYGRRRRNLAAKFGIAIGMLAVLGLMLSRLLGNAGDSRLLLADLLIQLQVLHTFDLPRRKDLGYSAVIGLILMGVAATISETMAFGGFLVLFAAIALPVLLLDYRSRLGLGTIRLQPFSVLSPRRLGMLLGAILGLGLLIFAITPRLPGYQFRTLPVSGEVAMPQGKFDPAQVFNPGYVRTGRGGKAGTAGGETMSSGQGQSFSAKFYYGFNEEMNQNLRGSLKPEVVMRVRSQSEGFWRVMAFDRYTGQGWKVSRNKETNIVRRPSWSYRFVLPPLQSQSHTKEVVQTFSILTEFPNLLPSLSQAREVYFPTQEIAVDAEGGMRSPGPLEEGLTYSVVSDVPYRDRSRLNRTPTTYSRTIRENYLQIPGAIAPQIRQIAEQLLAKSQRPLPTPYEKSLYLTQAIKQGYALQANIPSLQPNQDLAIAFLTDWKGGYPDHFASVLTLLLRSIGIPARLATGFSPGEFNPFTGLYVVKNTDAYALSEVYFPKQGWFAFDAIPGHDLYPPSVEVDQTFSVLRQFWNWVAGWLPSPMVGWMSGAIVFLGAQFSRVLGLFSQGWAGILKLSLLSFGFGIGIWGLWHAGRTIQNFDRLRRLPPMARLYQQMLRILAEQGLQKHPSETPLEYLQQVRSACPEAKADIVAELSQAYVAWRYGESLPDIQHLQKRLQQLKHGRTRPSAIG